MNLKSRYPEALDHAVFKVLSDAAASLNLEAYVIGGFVRDYYLARGQKKDIDILAVGSGIQLAQKVKTLLPNSTNVSIFKNFGTAMIKTDDLEIEFVGARKESYDRGSRKPIVEDGTLEDDQNRRDFTINAMAFSLNAANFGLLVDPFNGMQDLENKIIRTPLDPGITYSDDPLRMLRAIRFATQLHFTIEENSFNSVKEHAQRLEIISNERIVSELHKIMECSNPSRGFILLEQTGLLAKILPELTALKGIDEVEGQTHKDNFYHTLEVVDNIAKQTEDLWLRWAALLHDIGKAPTKRFNNKVGWTFHGHEFKGSKMVFDLFKRLHMPLNDKMKFVQKLVRMSSRPIAVIDNQATDSAVRRLIHDAGEDIESLMTLCEADITTKNPKRFARYHQNFELVRSKMVEVEERDQVRNFQPPVSGEEIMETFNLKPCREIGTIKSAIKDSILDGVILNEYEAARTFMLKKGAELGLTIPARDSDGSMT
jgi:tRNA nucleotidyltransferase (CCA-adding enzyme)